MSKIFDRSLVLCLVAAATIAAPAQAAGITYLECELPSAADEMMVWKIALDESAKTVSFEHPQASATRPAIFTADKVTWSSGRFVISRVNLSISKEFLGKKDRGQCKVAAAPKRAF